MTLVAATRNPAKLSELRRMVGSAAAVAPLPHDISHEISDEEAGASIQAIARAKACAWSRLSEPDAWVIASDGGLTIPALGSRWSPVRTRRFAGEKTSDLERALRLLELTADLVGGERRIGWVESVAIARGGMLLAQWSAESVPGLLAGELDPTDVEAGNGFWVPAVWRCPEYGGRLLADLSPAERERRDDHWRRLAGPIRAWLRTRR